MAGPALIVHQLILCDRVIYAADRTYTILNPVVDVIVRIVIGCVVIIGCVVYSGDRLALARRGRTVGVVVGVYICGSCSVLAVNERGVHFGVIVSFGIIVLYGAVCVLSLGAAGLMIEPSVISTNIGHHADFADYLRLALLLSALATVGGALGGALESDAAVREAAYAYRHHTS